MEAQSFVSSQVGCGGVLWLPTLQVDLSKVGLCHLSAQTVEMKGANII